MKVFLTGGTGYIGNRIALHFANKGITVHALVRSKQKSTLLMHNNILLFTGDIHQADALETAMQGCDVVIHSAAFSALYTPKEELYAEINIKGSQNVFTAAQKVNVKKIIYISTAGILGPSDDMPVHEETKRTTPYFNEYERTKAEAEKWLLAQSNDSLAISSLNLTRVFGPGQLTEANAGTRLIHQVANGWRIIPGDGKSIGNYVYIDDVLDACYQTIEKGKSGHRYIIGGDNIDFNTYFSVAKKTTGATQKMINLPVSIIMGLSRVMLWFAPLGIAPTITPPWVKRYMYNWVLDNTKAKTELGISFTPFEEGVEKTVEWLKQNPPKKK